MGTIKSLLEGVRKVHLRDEVPAIIQNTSSELIDYNQGQLYEGLTSKGDEITPGYAGFLYENFKHELNPRPGRGVPDLFLTGAFYRGFEVITTSETFELDSTDSKSSELKAKYGDDIFGLTRENKKMYTFGVFFNNLKSYIELITGLKFQ